MKMAKFVLILIGGLAVFSGCSGSEDGEPVSLVDAANDGIHYDYEPLASPEQARRLADVIVVGRIVGAQEASEIRDASTGRDIRYAVLEVEPMEVLSGEPHSADRIYVAFVISRQPEWEAIDRGLPDGSVLLILDDLSDWRSGELVGFPAEVYAPFTDGFWFEADDGELTGLWVEPGETAARWNAGFDSLDELVVLIRGASR